MRRYPPDFVICLNDLPGRATALLVCEGSALGPVLLTCDLSDEGRAEAESFIAQLGQDNGQFGVGA